MAQNVTITLTVAAKSLYQLAATLPSGAQGQINHLAQKLCLFTDDHLGLYGKPASPVNFESEVDYGQTVTWTPVSLDTGYTVKIKGFTHKTRHNLIISHSASGSNLSGTVIVNPDAEHHEDYTIDVTIELSGKVDLDFSIDPILKAKP